MGASKRSANILVVEDETAPASQALETLRAAGHAVRLARSARDARAEMHQEVPDLLVLDLSLEIDGLELLQALRFSQSDPRAGIVVLVDHRDTFRRERAHQLGAAAVLTKPLRTEVLATAVRELMDWL